MVKKYCVFSLIGSVSDVTRFKVEYNEDIFSLFFHKSFDLKEDAIKHIENEILDRNKRFVGDSEFVIKEVYVNDNNKMFN